MSKECKKLRKRRKLLRLQVQVMELEQGIAEMEKKPATIGFYKWNEREA